MDINTTRIKSQIKILNDERREIGLPELSVEKAINSALFHAQDQIDEWKKQQKEAHKKFLEELAAKISEAEGWVDCISVFETTDITAKKKAIMLLKELLTTVLEPTFKS